MRDHILHETAYPWATVAEGLPYAITELLVFRPDTPLEITINDISTTFSKPADYHKSLSGVAAFARDRRDTPMGEIRLLDAAEMLDIAKLASAATLTLYKTLAGKDREQKIRDGVMVYTREMMMPIAQKAGIWDRFVADGFDELSDLASAAWPTLTGGAAAEVLPPVFLLGEGFPPVGGGAA